MKTTVPIFCTVFYPRGDIRRSPGCACVDHGSRVLLLPGGSQNLSMIKTTDGNVFPVNPQYLKEIVLMHNGKEFLE